MLPTRVRPSTDFSSEQLSTLLGDDHIRDSQQILVFLGIVVTSSAGVIVSLLELYKSLYGKHSEDVQTFEAFASGGNVTYQVVGNENKISVSPDVHKLAQDPRMFPTVKRILAPLTREGYDSLEFLVAGKVTQYFSRDEASRIIQAPEEAVITRNDKELVSTIRTAVRVRKAVFEGASKWTIVYKRAVDARIADEQWLADYQAGRVIVQPHWKLLVELEERVPINEDGEEAGTPSYTILKVLGVERSPNQITMPL